jgi:uncharacterized protein (TIGR03435 family)
MRTIMSLAAVVIFTGVLFAQAPTPAFEVASVTPGNSLPPPGTGGAQIRPEQFDAPSYPLQALVSLAHGVSGARITGWPEWTRAARYDVRAKTGKPSTRQEVLAMLQTLLAERFSLKVHRETREMDIYMLVVAKAGSIGPKLQRVEVDCETKKLLEGSGPGLFPPDARPACGTSRQTVRMVAGPSITTSARAAWTMEQLAISLGGGVGRPVVDRTGLNGTFDAELTYVTENPASPSFPVPSSPQPPPDGVSLRDAIRQQLGLDLRAERGPVEFLVIDSIERPTPN